MQHAFQLATPLAVADIERLTSALSAVPGVRAIELAPGSPEVTVRFDADATSPRAIDDAAARAGYQGRPRAPSGCCGGCCGG
ncbi:cation transporter [Massilia sp. TN1-12]|uniref:cation transporter n=1 Tax=Massilia paldalensis TaxID=3377675 RepID=UPI00384FB27E